MSPLDVEQMVDFQSPKVGESKLNGALFQGLAIFATLPMFDPDQSVVHIRLTRDRR